MSARVCKHPYACKHVQMAASTHMCMQLCADTHVCPGKSHRTGMVPRVGTHGPVWAAQSVILPKSGGSAAALRCRLGLFLNPLAPSDSHAACSPLLPGKLYTTKIDVLERRGREERESGVLPPRRRGSPPLPGRKHCQLTPKMVIWGRCWCRPPQEAEERSNHPCGQFPLTPAPPAASPCSGKSTWQRYQSTPC